MILIAVIALVMFLLFKWKEQESGLDGFAAITIVFVPGALAFGLGILVHTFELPQFWLWLINLVYFICPWLLLWKNNGLPVKRAAVYGGVVWLCFNLFSAFVLAIK